MSVAKREVRTITIIYPLGQFWGGDETEELRQSIHDTIGTDNKRLIFNLRGCTRMNSTAMGSLIAAKRDYDDRGGRVILCEMNQELESLLVTAGLILKGGLEYLPTEAEALAAFAEGAVEA